MKQKDIIYKILTICIMFLNLIKISFGNNNNNLFNYSLLIQDRAAMILFILISLLLFIVLKIVIAKVFPDENTILISGTLAIIFSFFVALQPRMVNIFRKYVFVSSYIFFFFLIYIIVFIIIEIFRIIFFMNRNQPHGFFDFINRHAGKISFITSVILTAFMIWMDPSLSFQNNLSSFLNSKNFYGNLLTIIIIIAVLLIIFLGDYFEKRSNSPKNHKKLMNHTIDSLHKVKFRISELFNEKMKIDSSIMKELNTIRKNISNLEEELKNKSLDHPIKKIYNSLDENILQYNENLNSENEEQINQTKNQIIENLNELISLFDVEVKIEQKKENKNEKGESHK